MVRGHRDYYAVPRTLGSVRGAARKGGPYRDTGSLSQMRMEATSMVACVLDPSDLATQQTAPGDGTCCESDSPYPALPRTAVAPVAAKV